MKEQLEDRNVVDVVPLTSPSALKRAQPLGERSATLVLETRRAIRDILHGRDRRRVLVVVGPCSIHDPEVAYEYARRLRPVAEAVRENLLVVMRTYFEKPRTTVGWKGLVNDPHLDGSCDVEAGLRIARTVLRGINELGVPCGTEVLDPITPQYLSDLLSWASIGARTIESQTHRELASGLSMPIGFKNSTDGALQVALHAMISARHAHTFLGIDTEGVTAMIKTQGNPDRHVVLRGGAHGPNHAAEDVARAAEMVAGEGVARAIMVDCSHDNSGKDHTRQAAVCREVLKQVRLGQSALMGLLLESNLQPGKQAWKPGASLAYGVSITDACMGWDETEPLLYEIADAVGAAPSVAVSA
jgi:3-deoxy-7-phosphoheptulonate synthase